MKRRLVFLMVPFLFVIVFCIIVPVKAEQGVTGKTIKVGFVGPLSGPAAIVGINGVEGIRLYFKHLNDTGGIHGRKLTLVVEDDGYHPARHLAGVKKMLYRDKVFCFAGNTGTPCIPASIPLIEKEKVPVVAPIATRSKPFIPFERYFFFMALQYDVQARLMVDYIMKDIKAVQPKIAFIGQNDSLGKMGLIGVKESGSTRISVKSAKFC